VRAAEFCSKANPPQCWRRPHHLARGGRNSLKTSPPIVATRSEAARLSPSRAPRGAGYHVLADTTRPTNKPATVAGDTTLVPSRVRAMKGELRAWRRRLANPEHSHRVTVGS